MPPRKTSQGKLPYMPLYWRDLLADTGHLTAAELGLYIRALGRMWLSDGHVTQSYLDRIADSPDDLPAVLDLLTPDKDGFTQKRLKAELNSAKRKSRLAKDAVNARWNKGLDTDVLQPTDTDTDTDTEVNNITPSISPPAKPSRRKPKTAEPPADFAPTPATIRRFDERGLTHEDISRQLAYLADKAASNGYRYADWNAALRNCLDWSDSPARKGADRGGKRSDRDVVVDAMQRFVARGD